MATTRNSSPFLSSLLGNLTAFAILGACAAAVGIYLIVIFAMATSGGKQDTVPSNAILVFDLSMNLDDTPSSENISGLMDEIMWGSRTPSLYLLEVVDGITRAAQDPNINALFITGSFIPERYGSGLAALREVRQAIQLFQDSGKPVYAYAIDPSLRDYYLMSAADHLTLNPFGLLTLNGLAAEGTFFGQAFEKYGIGVQTTRVGKYKSAVEMFTSDQMSPADREQMQSLLDDLWQQITRDIAQARGLEPAQLIEDAARKGFFSAEEALAHQLVDHVAYFDHTLDSLESIAAYDYDYDTFTQISLSSYIGARGFMQERDQAPSHAATVAVLYAEGDIVNGEGSTGQIGGERLARKLRSLRQDSSVDAVVLRINSPGGSAIAAELIEREVLLTREVKPLIVSMGSLAASGGYWIAAPAQRIYAEPYTITGSIGVWGLMFNLKELANQHGITFDGVKTSPLADIYTISREKTPEEMAVIQEFTDFIYDAFLHKVASGRSMSLEQVESLAQGRVWTGQQALELGLVDEIGGLEKAIRHAADLVSPGQPWKLRQFPEKRSFSEALIDFLESQPGSAPVVSTRPGLLGQAIARFQHELHLIQSLNDPRGVYARLPWQPVIP